MGDLELSSGIKITVRSMGAKGMEKSKMPSNMQDLKFYMPRVLSRKEDHITLFYLIIPGPKAPRSLRRVLAAFIKNLQPTLSQNEVISLMREAEEKLLVQNMDYYRVLDEKCAAARAVDPDNEFIQMIEQMSNRQKDWIKAYDERLGLNVVQVKMVMAIMLSTYDKCIQTLAFSVCMLS